MTMRTLIATLLVCASATAAPVPKELKQDDATRLVGEWQTVRSEFNGREYIKDYLIFTRDTVNWKPQKDGPDYLWKLTLDPTASPKEFQIVMSGNMNIRYSGLYKLDGDRLTLVCKQNAKPDGFTSENGTYYHELVCVAGAK